MELVLKTDCAVLNIKEKNSDDIELTGLIHYLLRDNLIDLETAKIANEACKKNNISLISYLIRTGILSSQLLLTYCSDVFGLPIFDLKNYDPAQLKHAPIGLELIYYYRVIPLHQDKNGLHLGITDPSNHTVIAAIGFHTGLRICPILVAEEELTKIIEAYCKPAFLDSQLESAISKTIPTIKSLPQENNEHHDEPVIEVVNRLLQDAIGKSVSDIHIEPYEHHCRIRFRRDGILYEATTIPLNLASRMITRLKIIANLNIAERRLPQDGRILIRNENKIDIRINTCPTLFGEKIVLRLLNEKNIHLDFDILGLTPQQKSLLVTNLNQPQGLILVTGPTGSGKTTTLYSALHYLNNIEKNISSIEDPVEIELNGINQINVNPRIGLDFSSLLRTILRQDPEVIMIGEIRDVETATIAMQAAQTGHLVLSTLHTNSAIETLSRLRSMDIATYHLLNSLSLVIAQRLIRKLCMHCKRPEILPNQIRDKFQSLSFSTVYRAHECHHCHRGYQGRMGIFELVPLTEKISSAILADADTANLLTVAKQENISFLWESGLEKVAQGITSLDELIRVLGIPKITHTK